MILENRRDPAPPQLHPLLVAQFIERKSFKQNASAGLAKSGCEQTEDRIAERRFSSTGLAN
ncbi:hypothetical protein D3C71_1736500 [compost metagenome]